MLKVQHIIQIRCTALILPTAAMTSLLLHNTIANVCKISFDPNVSQSKHLIATYVLAL